MLLIALSFALASIAAMQIRGKIKMPGNVQKQYVVLVYLIGLSIALMGIGFMSLYW